MPRRSSKMEALMDESALTLWDLKTQDDEGIDPAPDDDFQPDFAFKTELEWSTGQQHEACTLGRDGIDAASMDLDRKDGACGMNVIGHHSLQACAKSVGDEEACSSYLHPAGLRVPRSDVTLNRPDETSIPPGEIWIENGRGSYELAHNVTTSTRSGGFESLTVNEERLDPRLIVNRVQSTAKSSGAWGQRAPFPPSSMANPTPSKPGMPVQAKSGENWKLPVQSEQLMNSGVVKQCAPISTTAPELRHGTRTRSVTPSSRKKFSANQTSCIAQSKLYSHMTAADQPLKSVPTAPEDNKVKATPKQFGIKPLYSRHSSKTSLVWGSSPMSSPSRIPLAESRSITCTTTSREARGKTDKPVRGGHLSPPGVFWGSSSTTFSGETPTGMQTGKSSLSTSGVCSGSYDTSPQNTTTTLPGLGHFTASTGVATSAKALSIKQFGTKPLQNRPRSKTGLVWGSSPITSTEPTAAVESRHVFSSSEQASTNHTSSQPPGKRSRTFQSREDCLVSVSSPITPCTSSQAMEQGPSTSSSQQMQDGHLVLSEAPQKTRALHLTTARSASVKTVSSTGSAPSVQTASSKKSPLQTASSKASSSIQAASSCSWKQTAVHPHLKVRQRKLAKNTKRGLDPYASTNNSRRAPKRALKVHEALRIHREGVLSLAQKSHLNKIQILNLPTPPWRRRTDVYKRRKPTPAFGGSGPLRQILPQPGHGRLQQILPCPGQAQVTQKLPDVPDSVNCKTISVRTLLSHSTCKKTDECKEGVVLKPSHATPVMVQQTASQPSNQQILNVVINKQNVVPVHTQHGKLLQPVPAAPQQGFDRAGSNRKQTYPVVNAGQLVIRQQNPAQSVSVATIPGSAHMQVVQTSGPHNRNANTLIPAARYVHVIGPPITVQNVSPSVVSGIPCQPTVPNVSAAAIPGKSHVRILQGPQPINNSLKPAVNARRLVIRQQNPPQMPVQNVSAPTISGTTHIVNNMFCFPDNARLVAPVIEKQPVPMVTKQTRARPRLAPKSPQQMPGPVALREMKKRQKEEKKRKEEERRKKQMEIERRKKRILNNLREIRSIGGSGEKDCGKNSSNLSIECEVEIIKTVEEQHAKDLKGLDSTVKNEEVFIIEEEEEEYTKKKKFPDPPLENEVVLITDDEEIEDAKKISDLDLHVKNAKDLKGLDSAVKNEEVFIKEEEEEEYTKKNKLSDSPLENEVVFITDEEEIEDAKKISVLELPVKNEVVCIKEEEEDPWEVWDADIKIECDKE